MEGYPMQRGKISRGNGSGRKKIVMMELYPKMPNIGRFIITPRYGMLAVASALAERSGYQVVSLFEPYLGKITPEDVAAMEPFCVMTNGLTTTAPDNEAFFERFKEVTQGRIPIVAGGEHATMYPEDAKAYADFILAYEGDESVFPFLEALEESDPLSRDSLFSQVPGLHYRGNDGKWRFNPGVGRVAAIDYRYDLSIMPGAEGASRRLRATSIPLQTSRGCRYVCSFCSWVTLFGKPGYRLRPPEDVVHDVVHSMEYVGTRNFIVCDNLFAGDDAHMEELCGRLVRAFEGKSERPCLTVCMRADQLCGSAGSLSEQQVALMARAGVSVVSFGLESTNERSLIQMRKGMTTRKYLSAAETLRRHGISYLGTFVSGFDGDTLEDIGGIADFAEQMGLFTIQLYARSVPPGTIDMILSGHRSIPGRLNRYANGHAAWFLPTLMLPSQLQEAVFKVTLRFHQGVASRRPALRVFSTIWDRLQPHMNALRRIEGDVLMPMGIYRQTRQGFQLDDDKLRRVCEDPDAYERYATTCGRIFREAEALSSAGVSARAGGAVASGRGALRTVV
jgi:radical SAM superfamily enzyme YgiQ (UPF0313 family)